MNRLRWQLLIVALALVVIAVLLLGQQPILRAFVPAPAEGGLYSEGLVGSMNRLNPLLDYANPADQDINRLIFSGLIRFDDRGNPQPDLAEKWAVSLDGLVYNFTLRPDALWHDGEALTTADIVFTTNFLAHADTPIPENLRELWQSIEVVAFDELNMQFRLSEAFAPFLDYLAFGVLPEHLLRDTQPLDLSNSPFNLSPIGTGSYTFGEILIEDGQIAGVVLEAFENHYFERPFIDQIIFRYFENSEVAYQAYLEGEILGISDVSEALLPSVLQDDTLNIYSSRLPKLSIVLLNLNKSSVPFFQEVEVRQALLQGVNRQKLIDAYLSGQGFVADGPILPGTWAYNENMAKVSFDSDQAVSILKAAGYTIPAEGGAIRSKDGIRLSFELVHPDTELHGQVAESIQENWAKLGVSVELVAVDYAILLSDYLETGNYDAALVDLNLARTPDPDPYPFWHQAEANGGQNYSRWDDRRASEYLEQARVSISQNQRTRLYRNFQTHFSIEMPALPLYYPIYNYALSAQVQGVSVGPLLQSSDRLANINEWFLVARSELEEVDSASE
jgi:peptide/nickel transport system substrate-binding protein